MKVTELAPGLSCTVHFIKNYKEWRQERGLEIDHEYMCIALMPGEGMGLTYEQALQKGLNKYMLPRSKVRGVQIFETDACTATYEEWI